MEYILPYLAQFTYCELILLAIFFLLFCLQVRYYMVYYRKPYNYAKRDKEYEVLKQPNQPKVSVIIVAENESELLAQNIPVILEQDYPNFEVVVVNMGSTDDSHSILQRLSIEDERVYHTYVPESYDRSFNSRKLALTVGVKGAKGDIVLFTEVYSKPLTKNWIASMVKDLFGEIEVVLGYSSFEEHPGFNNKMERFDNHYFSMQYMSMALKNKPYTATYRNIAMKKALFFKHKGFADFLGMSGGEEIFFKSILTDRNKKIASSQDSFVESNICSTSLWAEIKETRSYAKNYLGSATKTIFPIEYASRYLFHICFVAVVVFSALSGNYVLLTTGILLWLIRYIHQLVVVNKSTKHFRSGQYYLSLPFFELLQPLYNIKFRSRQKRLGR